MLHKLPKIQYSLDGKEDRFIANIFRRISLNHSGNAERYNLLSDYFIQSGDSPESIANERYGNVSYWWVVLVVNPQFKTRDDWPMTDNQLRRWLEDNYGTRQFEREKNGNDFDLPFTVDGVVQDHHTFDIKDTSLIRSIEVDAFTANEAKRKIKLITPEHLKEFVKQYEAATSQVFRNR